MSRSVLIVEDEPLIADDLSFHLQDLGVENVQIALKYETAIEKIASQDFDLLFLDVNLSSDKDGVDVARFAKQSKGVPFIFLTSYFDDETIQRAKELDPIAYLLKPFDKRDIKINVELAFHKQTHTLDKQHAIDPNFFIKDKTGLIAISPKEIRYVEAFDNYAKVFDKSKEHIVSHTLKSIEEKLIDYGFIRIHKSFLVNFSHVTMISEGYVFFGNEKLPIGRAYKSTLMDQISVL